MFGSVTDDVNWYIEQKLVHSIHTSSRLSFRGCRRRWDWASRQMYYPLVTPKPLEFGSAFHKGMEKLYDPMTWGQWEVAEALAKVAFAQECKDQYSRYLKLNRGNIDPTMKQEYDDRIIMGLGMIQHYAREISPKFDQGFIPVKVEIEFEVPIVGPEGEQLWCKCSQCEQRYRAWLATTQPKTSRWSVSDELANAWFATAWKGLPVTYGGRIDMLAKDDLGRYWIFDWKTAAQMTSHRNDNYMLLDDQITSYCWALWSIGFPVAGFVYSEIKKGVPSEPEPNKSQRLGRWYSVNKQINTTPEIYERTVKEGDPAAYAAGLYDDFITYLKSDEGPKFHNRHQIFRSETELRNAGINIYHEACEMTDPNLRIYPSPGRFACSFCAYQDPCLMKNKGEDHLYALRTLFEKREKHYWEDRAPSTDTRGGS